MERLLEAARSSSGNALLWLRGPRRSGKTSCLKELERRAREEALPCLTIRFDFRAVNVESFAEQANPLSNQIKASLRSTWLRKTHHELLRSLSPNLRAALAEGEDLESVADLLL